MRLALAAAALLLVDAPVVVWDASPNYTASNREVTYDIDTIVIHTTEGSDTNGDGYYAECYTQAINWFNNPSASASAHYVVAPWGAITQMVTDDDIAWHATYYNNRSIGIECAGFAGSPSTWTPELLAALTQLVAWLCQQYGVPAVHPTDNANDWGGWYGGTGVIAHAQVQTSGSAAAAAYGVRTDPGPYFPWSTFMANVNAALAPSAPSNLQALAYLYDGAAAADFSWDAATGADGYWLDIAQSPGDLESMSGTFQNLWVSTNTIFTWTGLTPGATYSWRVYAYNGYGGAHAYPSGPVTMPTPAAPPADPPPATGGSRGGGGGGGCSAGPGSPAGVLLLTLLTLAALRAARR